MVDDLGKDWISCYGTEDVTTPNIDALAKGGMKFHNAYSIPSCTPSRVTLLTVFYFAVTDERGLMVSSEYLLVE